jgi:hypothetical protein
VLVALEAWPPDIVVCLFWGVVDKLAARVERSVWPDVDAGHVPHCHIRYNDAGLVADPNTKANAVKTSRVNASGEPEAVLKSVVSRLHSEL